MADTLHDFNVDLYEEHLEEISFLWEQRCTLIAAGKLGWTALGPFEDRLEAHLDALMVGGTLALDVCSRLAAEGDAGQLFGAVVAFCRADRAPLLSALLKTLDAADAERVAAVTDALKWALPDAWTPFVALALGAREPLLARILAAVAAYRRLDVEQALLIGIGRHPASAKEFIDALGVLRSSAARAVIVTYLADPREDVRAASALALMRTGVPPESFDSSPTAAAIGSGRAAGSALRAALASPDAAAPGVLALGLLGDPASLRALYDTLDRPELAQAAAQALQWITGASMNKEIFVPEAVDEDALFADELSAWQQYKEAPKRLDGQTFGETATEISPDKGAWSAWLSQHLGEFDRDLRYRGGRPCTPTVLLEGLRSPSSAPMLRRQSALELEIRYGCTVRIEREMPVSLQMSRLREMSDWIALHGDRFEPGRWYFQGEPA